MSRRKAFLLRIEIGIHSVDCPEIRLCQSDNVAVRVDTLSSSAVTTPTHPPFPIHVHETLLFEKVVDCVSNLSQVQDLLNEEPLKLQFVHWPRHAGKATVLAEFRTKLSNILFPTLLSRDVVGGGRIKLLMETANKSAGGVHPKVEVTTRIALDEKSASWEIPAASTGHGCCEADHCRRKRTRNNGCDVRWPRGRTACIDCSICNSYSGFFDSKRSLGSTPRPCSFVKHWFTSGVMDKPVSCRQQFYENLELFYRQLDSRRKSAANR